MDQSSDISQAIEKLEDRDLLRLVELVQVELRDRVRIYRIMGRLTDKLAAAAAVAPRHAAAIEARADKIIAADADMARMTDEAFQPHETLLEEAQKGLDDLKHELATMSNNPPLSASNNCPQCAIGSTPRQLGTGAWVHDISVAGEAGVSQVPCLNH